MSPVAVVVVVWFIAFIILILKQRTVNADIVKAFDSVNREMLSQCGLRSSSTQTSKSNSVL